MSDHFAETVAPESAGGVSEVRHAVDLADQGDLDLAYWAWTIIANVSQGRWGGGFGHSSVCIALQKKSRA